MSSVFVSYLVNVFINENYHVVNMRSFSVLSVPLLDDGSLNSSCLTK